MYARRIVLVTVLVLIALLQAVGQLAGGDGPPATALATSWIVQTAILVAPGTWINR